MRLLSVDFESTASAIPPPGLEVRILTEQSTACSLGSLPCTRQQGEHAKILINTLYGRITSTGTTDYLIPAGLKIPELFESCGCSTASNPLIEAGPSRIRTSHLHVFSCIFREMPLARFPFCLFTMPRQLTPHWEKTIGGTTPLRE